MNVYTRLIVGLGVPAADVPVVLEVMRAEHRTLDGLGPHQFKRAVQKAQAVLRDPEVRALYAALAGGPARVSP